MSKGDYATILFNDIKDNIEFDSDVIALEKLLNIMLESSENHGFNNWKYLIDTYDINSLKNDIDFTPLVYEYPINFLKTVGIKAFFNNLHKFTPSKRNLIYCNIFNIYNKDNDIYSFFTDLIKSQNFNEEKLAIDLILANSKEFFKEIFDKTEFIKKIIQLHLEYDILPVELLKELVEIPDNKKEKAILKTLLIDYICY